MSIFGRSELNNYKYIEYLVAKNPEELKRMMREITLPFKVVSIYSHEGNHVAWLNLSENIRKIKNLKE